MIRNIKKMCIEDIGQSLREGMVGFFFWGGGADGGIAALK